MLNSKKEVVSVENLFVVIKIDEQYNIRSGDVDTLLACEFNTRNCENIGEYAVVLRGQQIKPVYKNTTGNGAELWKRHGNELLRQFQLID